MPKDKLLEAIHSATECGYDVAFSSTDDRHFAVVYSPGYEDFGVAEYSGGVDSVINAISEAIGKLTDE